MATDINTRHLLTQFIVEMVTGNIYIDQLVSLFIFKTVAG